MPVNVEQEIQLFKEAVIMLWQAKCQDIPEYSESNRLVYDTYPPINGLEALEALLPGSKKNPIQGSFNNLYLWLQKTAGMLPIVHLKYDFSCSIPEIRIRLGLFLEKDGESNAIGFRFESPEGTSSSGAGRHHYYHVQMIKAFKNRDGNFGILLRPDKWHHQCPDWLPTREPALPLPAEDSLSLFLCFAASLYGIDETRRLIGGMTGLKSYLGKHPFKAFDSLEWYRQITTEKKLKVSVRRLFAHPEEAEPGLRRSNPNTIIEAITKKRYEELAKDRPSKKRK